MDAIDHPKDDGTAGDPVAPATGGRAEDLRALLKRVNKPDAEGGE